MGETYKPATAAPRVGHFARRLAVAGLLIAAGVGAGRAMAPNPAARHPTCPPTQTGITLVDGLPTGFPPTVRGAGDAAAWFETALAAAGSWPQAQIRGLLERMVADEVRDSLVDQLMPSTAREGNTNIAETVVLRVWAKPAPIPGDLPVGSQVRVRVLALGLFGPRTDGTTTSEHTGLAGGFTTHDLVMQRTADRWVLREAATPVPAAPPDLQGTQRDGSPRRVDALAEVLGPDSWVPNTP